MAAPFARKKQRIGFFYGLVAGAVLSMTAWGVDAIQLAGAHVSFPFTKFLPGLIICALAGGIVGWLSIRIGHWLASIILWILLAVLAVWLVLWLPVNGRRADPALAEPQPGALDRIPAHRWLGPIPRDRSDCHRHSLSAVRHREKQPGGPNAILPRSRRLDCHLLLDAALCWSADGFRDG